MRYATVALALFFPFFTTKSFEPEISMSPRSDHQYELNISMPVEPGDGLYADYLTFSVDSPHVALSEWHTSTQPTASYDTRFKRTMSVYEKPFSVTMNATLNEPNIEGAKLHIGTYSRATQKNSHYTTPLSFALSKQPEEPKAAYSKTDLEKRTTKEQPSSKQTKKFASNIQNILSARSLQELFTTTDSWALRLIVALLLGLLLSLTPCIYPMIPITVGILQSQGSKSMGRNFLISFIYVLGIATTFAALGTTAAFSGKMFGSFMKSPFVILAIVALLIYLAGSMIGFYDMYIPRFLQNNNQQTKKRLTAFCFSFWRSKWYRRIPLLITRPCITAHDGNRTGESLSWLCASVLFWYRFRITASCHWHLFKFIEYDATRWHVDGRYQTVFRFYHAGYLPLFLSNDFSGVSHCLGDCAL